MAITRELNPPYVIFTSDVPILKKLHNQSFGPKEAERLALCPLASSIFDLATKHGIKIGTVTFEKPTNGQTGSIIKLRMFGGKPKDQHLDLVQKHLEKKLSLLNRAFNTLINERKLKARLSKDEFVPFDKTSIPQAIFAGVLNKKTLPGVRGDGGNLIVKKFYNDGKNKPVIVDLLAEGACVDCPSSGTVTLRQLHRLASKAFADRGYSFGSIRVFEERNPNKLAYTVTGEGIKLPPKPPRTQALKRSR